MRCCLSTQVSTHSVDHLSTLLYFVAAVHRVLIGLYGMSARPGGKRCVIVLSTQMCTAAVDHLSTLLHLLLPCTGFSMVAWHV